MEEYAYNEDEYCKIVEEYDYYMNIIFDKFDKNFTIKNYCDQFKNTTTVREYKKIKIVGGVRGIVKPSFIQELYYNNILIIQTYFDINRRQRIYKIERNELNKLLKDIEEIKWI